MQFIRISAVLWRSELVVGNEKGKLLERKEIRTEPGQAKSSQAEACGACTTRTGDTSTGLRRNVHHQPRERPQQISQRLFHTGPAARTAGASRIARGAPFPRDRSSVRHLHDQRTRACAEFGDHGR